MKPFLRKKYEKIEQLKDNTISTLKRWGSDTRKALRKECIQLKMSRNYVYFLF